MVNSKSAAIATAKAFPKKHNRREAKVIETAESFSPGTSSDWVTAPTTSSGALNQLASQVKAMQCIVATYDKASMSGAQGAVSLGVNLPDNFIITQIVAHVITAISDGAGGSPTIQLLAATDNISSLSPSLSESDTAGVCRIGAAAPVITSAGPIVSTEIAPIITTGVRALNATIATANLTAGKIRWFIQGFQSI